VGTAGRGLCSGLIIRQNLFGDTDPDLGRDSKACGGGAPGSPAAGLAPPLPSFPAGGVDLKQGVTSAPSVTFDGGSRRRDLTPATLLSSLERSKVYVSLGN